MVESGPRVSAAADRLPEGAEGDLEPPGGAPLDRQSGRPPDARQPLLQPVPPAEGAGRRDDRQRGAVPLGAPHRPEERRRAETGEQWRGVVGGRRSDGQRWIRSNGMDNDVGNLPQKTTGS